MATSRVVLMGVVIVLLSVAFVPAGYSNQAIDVVPSYEHEDDPHYHPGNYLASIPALCLYSASSTTDAFTHFDSVASTVDQRWTIPTAKWFNGGLVEIWVAFFLIAYEKGVLGKY